MRDMTQLHPKLQLLANKLLALCAAQGIRIKIGECVRTIAEQDALYAQGRTAPGIIVTKARGTTLGSMHQWHIAFDFYLDMDVDGDGKSSDDAFNNRTAIFDKVGKIGESIGLEWGGHWTSVIDRPHMQLKDWGSTPAKLKTLYGTPELFIKSWYPSKKRISLDSSKWDIIWYQTQLTNCLKGYTIKVTGVYDDVTRIGTLMYWHQLGWGVSMEADGKVGGSSTVNALASGRKE